MLDNRLKMCAEMVSGLGTTVDVGTDHAYLAAELVMSGRCGRVIASDIKEGPLDSARKTVEKYGVAGQVQLVLSDGLENVPLDGVTDIVIAGMGGETIIEILRKKMDELDGVNLILQPMTKPELLRKWLYEAGFWVMTEKAVSVGERLYSVINAGRDIAPSRKLTEYEALAGFFDEDDELGAEYRKKESERLEKVGVSLEKSGNHCGSVHCKALAEKLHSGTSVMSIRELYGFLDEKYPFSAQEKWDNSGLLIENYGMECRKVLLSLDITMAAVTEANDKNAELIISHHPVIFEPLRRIEAMSPVHELISDGIAAICMHTNLDISPYGTNGTIVKKIAKKFELKGEPKPFEELGGGNFLGYILELKDSVTPKALGEALKQIFGCEYIRANSGSKKRISKIAICSGSGGSMLGLAIAKGCDALVTGDIKHDVWMSANNTGIALFDCGHFHTENLVLEELRCAIEEKYPLLDVEIADSSTDPCVYI